MIFLDNSTTNQGRVLLLWKWEIWSIGGGSGVQWYFLGRQVRNPMRISPLWIIFNWQRREKK